MDAHKWLNVPYDGAMAIVADSDAHVAAMSLAGPYLVADPGQRDNTNYVPESSRRARVVPIYAALRSLGRTGVAELIERNCAQARRMAERLAAIPGARIVNDVVLNQVLVQLPGGDDANRAAVAAVQRDGTCWLGGTTWNDRVCASGIGLELGDDRRGHRPVSRRNSPCRRIRFIALSRSSKLHAMSVDRAALAVGGIRLASGISFLVDPLRANRLWGDPDEPPPTALLLLHSMGYRDALIGGLLISAALRGKQHPRLVPRLWRGRRRGPAGRDKRPP